MGQRQELEAEIARLQADLALLNSVPEDTFPFGTVVVFQSVSGAKWHYVKKGEELWEKLKANENTQHSLADWILEAKRSNVGYFEVYALIAEEEPFYASS